MHLSCEFFQARNWGKSDPIKHPAAVAIRKKIEPEHYLAAGIFRLINGQRSTTRHRLSNVFIIITERLKCGTAEFRRPERSELAGLSAVATTDLFGVFVLQIAKPGDLDCPDHDQEKQQKRNHKKIHPDVHVIRHHNFVGNPERNEDQWQMNELRSKRLLRSPRIEDRDGCY